MMVDHLAVWCIIWVCC